MASARAMATLPQCLKGNAVAFGVCVVVSHACWCRVWSGWGWAS
jgi:hypothetical protein